MSFDLNSIARPGGPGGPGGFDPRTNDLNALKNAGATTDQLGSITDRTSAEALANQLGVTLSALPPPPQGQGAGGSIFDSMFGNIVGGKPEGIGGRPPMGPPPEIVSALQAAGATSAEISGINGPQDAEALAAKYGITLPAPPQHNPGGQMGGVSGNGTDILALLQQLLGISKN